MKYSEIKIKLLNIFNLQESDRQSDDEWGFLNEFDKSIQKIGYATNLTPETIGEAVKNDVDLIITHHDAWDFVYGMKERCIELLNNHEIIHAYFHAPLDYADFGTCASLASELNLKNIEKATPDNCLFTGETEEPISFETFSDKLSEILQEPLRAFKNNENNIHKVGIVTGGGNLTTDIKIAVDCKCDTYVTGEYNLYSQQYSKFTGINLLIGSHTNTEIIGVKQMVTRLVADTDIEVTRLPEANY